MCGVFGSYHRNSSIRPDKRSCRVILRTKVVWTQVHMSSRISVKEIGVVRCSLLILKMSWRPTPTTLSSWGSWLWRRHPASLLTLTQWNHCSPSNRPTLLSESPYRNVKPSNLDRLGNWSGWKKNQFLTSLMTSSVRKSSLTIGLGVCQGTLMSTKRTRMSLECGDSSMVVLYLEEG